MFDAESSNLDIVIRSAASGEELVRLAAHDLPDPAESQGTSVRALKQLLAKRINLSRFRQRLFTDGGELLHDDIQLSPPLNLQLLKLDLLKRDKERDEAFMDACEQNRVPEVEDMLCGSQDPDTVFEFDHGYVTVLHLAAQGGCLEVVGLLLEAGADKDKCDSHGATPLHAAAVACGGQLEVAQLLLESGADKDKSDHQGATPLNLAAGHGCLQVARFLVEVGADKDKSDHQQRTPLHLAAGGGFWKVVKLLLEAGADKQKCDHNGMTPLHLAAEKGKVKIAGLLLKPQQVCI